MRKFDGNVYIVKAEQPWNIGNAPMTESQEQLSDMIHSFNWRLGNDANLYYFTESGTYACQYRGSENFYPWKKETAIRVIKESGAKILSFEKAANC